eukprot:7088691-Ditylum_brightwellii.AAC.1
MPEIAYSTHQCDRFCKSPKASHETSVNQIVRYLIPAKNYETRQEQRIGGICYLQETGISHGVKNQHLYCQELDM